MALLLVVPYEAQRNWMDAAIAGESPFADCWLCLAKASCVLPLDTTLAELLAIESDFPGYVRQKLTGWTPAFAGGGEVATTEADLLSWTASADDAQSVWGAFAINAAATKLWFMGPITPPVPTPFPAPLAVGIKLTFASVPL